MEKEAAGGPDSHIYTHSTVARVSNVARLKRLVSPAEVYRYALDDPVSDEAYGLADLGVTPTRLEAKALNTLRRFRSYVTHDDIIEVVPEQPPRQ
jgi:hypothetical protein